MLLSWNEIRNRAYEFAKKWESATSEQAEKQTFWNEFFAVFGKNRQEVAVFEDPVKKLSGKSGFIDLFWKGKLIVEHKSKGKSLEKAKSQANDYIQSLITSGKEGAPRYIIVSDFDRIALHDLIASRSIEFRLSEFPDHIKEFGFMAGYDSPLQSQVEEEINVRAVEQMGELHDALEEGGYKGHRLERFLVRILFCLFAEDTHIFGESAFTDLITNHTRPDGSDLGPMLANLFDVLNTPESERQPNLLDELMQLPYVNGQLFAENLGFASMNSEMRNKLLDCCKLDWSLISPAVFGSLFQSVMESKERRQVGAHYTSERDILKLIKSLFLDDLREEFEACKKNRKRLEAFHEKLGKLKFLDPACGCGNFLVVAYRELRLLELDVMKILLASKSGETVQKVTDIGLFAKVDVDCMHGIELLEFPARIAEVAMWLIDHQMNRALSKAFGKYYARLPLKKSAKIHHANALLIDWSDVIKPSECSYVLGNPPFVGYSFQSTEQKNELKHACGNECSGVVDYVVAWYFKAASYIEGTTVDCAFVSTNSITQGMQPPEIWTRLAQTGIDISFAYRTFRWQSEARGRASVHVVIIGFGFTKRDKKRVFEECPSGEILESEVSKLNGYLIEFGHVYAETRSMPICSAPKMRSGCKPVDDGAYLFSEKEKNEFLKLEPGSEIYFRPWFGSVEFINGIKRWCLWLGDCDPAELRLMPHVISRVQHVKDFREKSRKSATVRLSKYPTRFEVETFAEKRYLVIPAVSSERRNYIPMGFESAEAIPSNLVNVLLDATEFHFGVLTSQMHMAWVRTVCGRLKSDYRYSANLVYNSFPWPQEMTDKLKAAVESRAKAVLEVRSKFSGSTLADLYDPLTMPPELVKAHEQLDRAVEQCYRPKPFASDRERVEYLFGLYEQLTKPLIAPESSKKRPRKPQAE